MLGYDARRARRSRTSRRCSRVGRPHLLPDAPLPAAAPARPAEEIFLLLRASDGERRRRAGERACAASATASRVTDCVLHAGAERRKFEDALLRAKREAEAAQRVERRDASCRRQRGSSSRRWSSSSAAAAEEQAAELEAQSEELRSSTTSCSAQRGAGAAARDRRRGEPRQEPVPRDDEPRAAHAAQRDRRLRAAARDRRPRPGHRARSARRSTASRAASGTCCG